MLNILKISKILILVLILVLIGTLNFSYGSAQVKLPFLVKKESPLKAPRPLFVPDEIIVKFTPGLNENSIKGLERAQGISEKYISPFSKFRVFKIPQGRSVPEMVEIFQKNPLVEYAQPNYYVYSSFVPNDPFYCLQWHLDDSLEWDEGTESCVAGGNPFGGINMESAWDVSTGNSNVIVAVLDTGVAYENHPAPARCHIDTYRAFNGNSWWCGLDEPSWATEPGYGNGWKDYIQHSFDLTSATGTINFSYQYRHDLEVTFNIPFDKAFTEISSNSGDTWNILQTYTGESKVKGKVGWKAESLDLTSYAGNSVLIRFRVFTDETFSDEDGSFDSDGAFFVDEITLEDSSGQLFFDDVESGAGTWETTVYQQAPDLAGINVWVNSGEIPSNNIDDDSNGQIDDINGWDFINSDAHSNDDGSHGTHVAGTIIQTTNNNLGVAGVAFNTTIMPIKVLGAGGSGTHQQVADGIHYAVDNGAKIISMSLGGSASTILENAVAYAYNNGVTVVAACGNSNISTCDYPAAYDSYVIAVGATQYDETKAPYSSFGKSLDIMAPGGNTGVDQNNDGFADGVLQQTFSDTPIDWAYWFFQGTSMATPHVAGVAALLLAEDSALTPDEVRNALESTAEDLGTPGKDSTFGWGLVDAAAALLSLTPAVSISLTTDSSVDFGTLPLESTQDTTASGINDVQTVIINVGPANLDVKSTVFSDGVNTWDLDSSNGVNQIKWEFSTDGTTWTTFLTPDAVNDLVDNVGQGATQDLYLRITLPTETSSSNLYSSTITIIATTP